MIKAFLVLAAVLLSDGNLTIEGEKQIDIARYTILKVSPKGIDLRERFQGFSVADDYDDDEKNCTMWQLTPKPCEKVYKLKPFAYEGRVIGPVYFEAPAARDVVTGGFEIDPKKDLPPLSWKLVGQIALALLGLIIVVGIVYLIIRYLVRRVKEHRMSPVERAWVELERLLKKGLPGRGRYKDFYVELTMVVRRYIQRKYGVKAPNLTTEEFLHEFKGDELKEFLESADMVKFAGVKATPEMADSATQSARKYLEGDNVVR